MMSRTGSMKAGLFSSAGFSSRSSLNTRRQKLYSAEGYRPEDLSVMKAGDSSFSKSFATLTNQGGNLSLFNSHADPAREKFICRHGFTPQNTSVCSRESKPF
jgi:hypothetical protein